MRVPAWELWVECEDDSMVRGPTLFKHLAEIPIGDGLVGEREGAVLLHLRGSAKEGAERDAREEAANAHTADAQRREVRKAQLRVRESRQHVDRAIERTDNGCDV